MELVLVNGVVCTRKEITNSNVYSCLKKHNIDGIAHIVKVTSDEVYYEYVNGEMLKTRIENDQNMSREFITHLIYSVVVILNKLQRLNITHNNLTPENIIITPRGKIYLVDLGYSTMSGSCDYGESVLNTDIAPIPDTTKISAETYDSDILNLGLIIDDIDKNKYYSNIALKLITENVNEQFNNYSEIVLALNKEILTNQLYDSDNSFNMDKYYSPAIKAFLSFVLVIGMIVAFVNGESEPGYFVLDLAKYIYIMFVVCDLLDYVRHIVLHRDQLKNIIKRKIVFSLSVMTIFLVILMLFS